MDEPDRRWRWWLLGIFALGPVLFGLLVTADPPVQVGDALIWSLGAPCLLALLAWNWWISSLWRKFMFRDGPPPRTTYAERVQLAFMGVPREFLLQKPEEPDA